MVKNNQSGRLSMQPKLAALSGIAKDPQRKSQPRKSQPRNRRAEARKRGEQVPQEQKTMLAAIYVMVCNMQRQLLQGDDAKANALGEIRTECNKSGLCTLLRAGGEKVAVAFGGYVYLFRFSGAPSLTEEVHYSQSCSVDVPVQFAHPTNPKILVQCSRSTKMEAGDLFDLMEGRFAMSEKELDEVVFRLLELLVWLHCQQIVHNDLNPANIFVNGQPNGVNAANTYSAIQITVGDFSMATCYTGEPSEVRVGTRQWKLDERLESPYDAMLAQTFSFALVIWWVITGSQKLPGPNVLQMGSTWCHENEFKAAKFEAYAKKHSEFCALLQDALSPTPSDRPKPHALRDAAFKMLTSLYGDSIAPVDFTQSHHHFGQ